MLLLIELCESSRNSQQTFVWRAAIHNNNNVDLQQQKKQTVFTRRVVFSSVSRVFSHLLQFCFTALYMIGWQSSRHFLQNKSCLGRTHFPALDSGYMSLHVHLHVMHVHFSRNQLIELSLNTPCRLATFFLRNIRHLILYSTNFIEINIRGRTKQGQPSAT